LTHGFLILWLAAAICVALLISKELQTFCVYPVKWKLKRNFIRYRINPLTFNKPIDKVLRQCQRALRCFAKVSSAVNLQVVSEQIKKFDLQLFSFVLRYFHKDIWDELHSAKRHAKYLAWEASQESNHGENQPSMNYLPSTPNPVGLISLISALISVCFLGWVCGSKNRNGKAQQCVKITHSARRRLANPPWPPSATNFGRQNAQNCTNRNSIFVPFAPFCGQSPTGNPHRAGACRLRPAAIEPSISYHRLRS